MISVEAVSKKWDRAFSALCSLEPDARDRIRDTLNFDWSKETQNCKDIDAKIAMESWEIIDCNIRGIAARLHTIFEQLSPTHYITWRRALIRALDAMDMNYSADDREEDLEIIFLQAFERNARYSARGQSEIPLASAVKIDKKGRIAAEVASDIAESWDSVLGSEDWPAITAMQTICRTLHRVAP